MCWRQFWCNYPKGNLCKCGSLVINYSFGICVVGGEQGPARSFPSVGCVSLMRGFELDLSGICDLPPWCKSIICWFVTHNQGLLGHRKGGVAVGHKGMGKFKELINAFQHLESICWKYIFDYSLLLTAREFCTPKPLQNSVCFA